MYNIMQLCTHHILIFNNTKWHICFLFLFLLPGSCSGEPKETVEYQIIHAIRN